MHELLHLPGTTLIALSDLPASYPSVVEDGDSFEINAMLKAVHYARHSGLPTLADDSGLIVDALDGAPGVQSARWMGEGTPYLEKNTRLLELLEHVEPERRTARFVCVTALAWPDGCTLFCRGVAEGRIHHRIDGADGFGYDPVFWSFDGQATFGSLPGSRKNQISHRARAAGTLARLLASWPGRIATH